MVVNEFINDIRYSKMLDKCNMRQNLVFTNFKNSKIICCAMFNFAKNRFYLKQKFTSRLSSIIDYGPVFFNRC